MRCERNKELSRGRRGEAAHKIGRLLLFLVCSAFLFLPAQACMMGDMGDLDDTTFDDLPMPILDGQRALATHDIEGAQAIYNEAIDTFPDPYPELYVGRALTDLLLLPGTEPARELLRTHLMATEELDVSGALYAEEGYLYWLARGVPWEDRGTYSGIRALISSRLPWPAARLENVEAFFTGLITSLNEAGDDLVELADLMAPIQEDLEHAINAERYKLFYLPGAVFHVEDLAIYLGSAELRMLSALISGARATIYFATAYDYDFSLDDILGSQAGLDRHEDLGGGRMDDALFFLDTQLLRELRQSARLNAAREALHAGLKMLVLSLQEGSDQGYISSLGWREARGEDIDAAIDLFQALGEALYAPTELPGAEPLTRLDLSSIFDPGRVLPQDIRWFEHELAPDEGGEVESDMDPEGEESAPSPEVIWESNAQAWQVFWVDGIFSPPFDLEDPDFELEALDSGALNRLVEALFGQLKKDYSAAY